MAFDDLNKSNKLVITNDVLQAASINNPEKYILSDDPEADDITKALKAVVSVGLNEVPVVGAMLSGLLDLFWPGGEDSVWDSIKEKVERLVEEKIGEETANANRLRLKGICEALQNFADQPPKVQARSFHGVLSILIENEPLLIENASPWYNLPYLVPFGTLYLSGLYTQWKFCQDIDESLNSQPKYKRKLEEEVHRLQTIVQEAKKHCIERRKKDIHLTSLGHLYQITMEDPHTHAEVTGTCDMWNMVEIMDKVREQLDYDIDSKYGVEIDKILEPTHLWGRFIPGHEGDIQYYHHLEYPGGLWKGITPQTNFVKPQAVSGGEGRLWKIQWYLANDYYGTKEVIGILLVFENTHLLLGTMRRPSLITCTLELAEDEVIIGVTTQVSTDYRDRDRIELLAFTKAQATIDAQGQLRYEKSTRYANDYQPRYGVTYKEFTYTSEDGKSPPTCMLYAVGWSYNDDQEGFVGMFQPVFGCLETIQMNGISIWSFEKDIVV